MSTSFLTLSIMPGALGVYFAIFLLVVGGLVWYALRTKGDVRAVFSHGKTVLELEAKERNHSVK
ncbi:MAG: hypothetical protein WB711_15905 [Terriglobales bacterium]